MSLPTIKRPVAVRIKATFSEDEMTAVTEDGKKLAYVPTSKARYMVPCNSCVFRTYENCLGKYCENRKDGNLGGIWEETFVPRLIEEFDYLIEHQNED